LLWWLYEVESAHCCQRLLRLPRRVRRCLPQRAHLCVGAESADDIHNNQLAIRHDPWRYRDRTQFFYHRVRPLRRSVGHDFRRRKLRADIEDPAAKENRSLSSWIETMLKRAVDEAKRKGGA
jgi:hypothetical protein